MKIKLLITVAILTVGAVFYSCKKSDTPAPTTTTTPSGPSLYTQVGGTTMVSDPSNSGQMIEQGYLTLRSVVDSAIFVIAGDAQLQPYFTVLLAEVGKGDLTGFTALSNNLTDFLAVATGSTNTAYAYGGKSMVDAHNPDTNSRISEKVSTADFNKFVGDVGTGLAENGVTSSNNAALVNALVALLNTTQSAVVQR